MKGIHKAKDGGIESSVFGYWLFEIKSLASVVLLHFQGKSREAYHNHAFAAVSWLIKGNLTEYLIDGTVKTYRPSLWPIYTGRNTFHKVEPDNNSWVLSFRGPWLKTWKEYLPATKEYVVLTNGRKKVA